MPLWVPRRSRLQSAGRPRRASADAGGRIERTGDLPDVDESGAHHVLDVPGAADPVALDRRGVRGRIVLVVGRRCDDVVVGAVVEGADPLRAFRDLVEGPAGALLPDVADVVARVRSPEPVLEER